jgi:hypothetical protein
MEAATSITVGGAANSRFEPSGSVIVIIGGSGKRKSADRAALGRGTGCSF